MATSPMPCAFAKARLLKDQHPRLLKSQQGSLCNLNKKNTMAKATKPSVAMLPLPVFAVRFFSSHSDSKIPGSVVIFVRVQICNWRRQCEQ